MAYSGLGHLTSTSDKEASLQRAVWRKSVETVQVDNDER